MKSSAKIILYYTMTEVSANILKNLFVVGMTREDFIDNYKELCESGEISTNESLFSPELNENEIGALYDSIKINKTNSDNDTFTEDDINKLASLDGDDTSITEDDLSIHYKNVIKALENSQVSNTQTNSDTPIVTPAEGLDMLKAIKFLKIQEAEHKKLTLNNEIEELLNNDKLISNELKAKYKKSKQEISKSQSELLEKQRKYQNNNEDILSIKEKIARKKGEIQGTKNKDKQESLQNEIHTLASDSVQFDSDSKSLVSDISQLKSTISDNKSSLKSFLYEIKSVNSETAKQIEVKEQELNMIDINLETELAHIDSQIKSFEELQLKELEQSGKQSAYYSDIADGTIPDDGHIGKNAAQALSNAESQIGVRELTGHNDGKDIAKYRNGVSNGAPWCASFVSWCYKGNDVFGYQPSVSGIMMAADRKNLYSKKGEYTPKAGDIMIQKNGASHTGIVESVDPDGTVHTIEGNASNQVKRCTYKPGSRGYNQISGYVRMSEAQSA